MRVGFTGHQSRPGIQWSWVREQIGAAIDELGPSVSGYSSLAIGADQIFAEEVLARGFDFLAVIPYATYDAEFDRTDLEAYHALKEQSDVIDLLLPYTGEPAFYEAGKWIVDSTELMITVWDGEPSKGFGGTADIVAYAERLHRPIVHINTSTTQVVRRDGA